MQYDQLQVINGKETTYIEFKSSFQEVEEYYDKSHDKRSLLQDKEGKYWLYDFHEEMNFSGGEDAMYEHYFPLENKEQAEKYKNESILGLKTQLRPYYYSATPSFKIFEAK